MSVGSEGSRTHRRLHLPSISLPNLGHKTTFKVVGIAFISVVAVIAFIFGLLQTSLFAVTRVDVAGTTKVDKADALQLAGIKVGDPMIFVNTGRVEAKLESNPWVEHAHVSAAWPHVVSISITERKAVAVAQTANKQWAQIGADGVILALGASPASGLPDILDAKAPAQVGATMDTSVSPLIGVAELMPASLQPHVKQMQNQNGNLRLGLDTNTIVVLGDNTDMADKLMAAASVVSHTDAKKLAILDVRSPHLPIATPIPGSAPVNEGTTTTTTTVAGKKSSTSTTQPSTKTTTKTPAQSTVG